MPKHGWGCKAGNQEKVDLTEQTSNFAPQQFVIHADRLRQSLCSLWGTSILLVLFSLSTAANSFTTSIGYAYPAVDQGSQAAGHASVEAYPVALPSSVCAQSISGYPALGLAFPYSLNAGEEQEEDRDHDKALLASAGASSVAYSLDAAASAPCDPQYTDQPLYILHRALRIHLG